LREVLATNFPAVARILGDQRFDQMVREYLREFPSGHPSSISRHSSHNDIIAIASSAASARGRSL
jgi:hypothetical protein